MNTDEQLSGVSVPVTQAKIIHLIWYATGIPLVCFLSIVNIYVKFQVGRKSQPPSIGFVITEKLIIVFSTVSHG
jgi:hypothetical protein